MEVESARIADSSGDHFHLRHPKHMFPPWTREDPVTGAAGSPRGDAPTRARVSHQDMDRRRTFRRGPSKPTHPTEPHVPPPLTDMRGSSAVCVLTCQDDYFVDFLAKMASDYAFGAPRRFQIVFGDDGGPARIEHACDHERIYMCASSKNARKSLSAPAVQNHDIFPCSTCA